ncbi:MAG: hypothetical protein EKK39_10445 [Sphingobacteriales bacterium]|uniref:hypothetical protein n=1 Tax=Hydrotalea flava TaxID=714549 RepID=UPI000833CCD0|nr:hypothetical protein [Hydrotalea flava]RTL49850.1 MAG: hypothetical protein EKK39_10445 [Sphingobacteriales bacterium]
MNYTRITDNGCFLNPQEWGIEPFYTFMYRERNEGNGNLNAVMWNVKWNTMAKQLLLKGQLGYFALPNVKNTAMNKYGMPSYGQLNLDLKYQFNKQLAGFDAGFCTPAKKDMAIPTITQNMCLTRQIFRSLTLLSIILSEIYWGK